MRLWTRIAAVLGLISCAQATNGITPSASNASLAVAQPYDICPNGYFDLRYQTSLSFYSGRTTIEFTQQVQCKNSVYCNEYGSKITSVTCYNSRLGSSIVTWNCIPIFLSAGYRLWSSEIKCTKFSPLNPCVRSESCAFLYTPTRNGGAVYYVGGFGGTFGSILLIVLLCWCCRRRTRIVTTSNTAATSTVVINNNNSPPAPPPRPRLEPAPAAPSQAINQTIYLQGPAYPPAQAYPPVQQYPPAQAQPGATAYPLQQGYPMPCNQAPPPYNPNFMQGQKQGFY